MPNSFLFRAFIRYSLTVVSVLIRIFSCLQISEKIMENWAASSKTSKQINKRLRTRIHVFAEYLVFLNGRCDQNSKGRKSDTSQLCTLVQQFLIFYHKCSNVGYKNLLKQESSSVTHLFTWLTGPSGIIGLACRSSSHYLVSHFLCAKMHYQFCLFSFWKKANFLPIFFISKIKNVSTFWKLYVHITGKVRPSLFVFDVTRPGRQLMFIKQNMFWVATQMWK